jgi:hypothetical protein
MPAGKVFKAIFTCNVPLAAFTAGVVSDFAVGLRGVYPAI